MIMLYLQRSVNHFDSIHFDNVIIEIEVGVLRHITKHTNASTFFFPCANYKSYFKVTSTSLATHRNKTSLTSILKVFNIHNLDQSMLCV